MTPPRAGDEHRRARLLRDGAAPRGRIADKHECARGCIDLLTVDGEGRVTLDDDVELLVLRIDSVWSLITRPPASAIR